MRKTVLTLALLTLFFAFTFEDDLIDKIVAQFDLYNTSFPHEKVYLHLDKPYYMAGETIWFKAYLVESASLLPDTVSIPLYVELIDNKKGKLIDKKILKLEGGSGYADFALPDTLNAGYYRIRAYTNWMLNFDESLIFSKDFKVFKSNQTDALIKLNSQEIDFRFFPEGGNLVEGLESRLAYKAVDALGNGLDVTGIVLTEKGDTIINFESEHFGMGMFNFKPEVGEKYIAKVKYRNIFEKEIALPVAEREGFVIGVESVADREYIRLYVGHTIENLSSPIAIIGQASGQVCYAAKTIPTKKGLLMKIPKNKFPQGVVQFTVFDEKGVPRCERVVFLKKDKQLNISILSNKEKYSPREKVIIDINAKDENGKPIEGDFSVAVSDASQVLEMPNEENILTYLQLSADVNGKIEQPAYYFSKNNVEAGHHLDILMMTQGWRRFKWADVLKTELPVPKFSLERGISLSGEISRQNGKPFEKPVNLTFIFSLKDSTRLFGMGLAEKNGSFTINNLNFIDSAKVIVQAIAGQYNRSTKIHVNRTFSPKIQLVAIPYNAVAFEEKELADYLKRTKDALELEKLLRFNKSQMLKEVVVKAKRNEVETDSRVLYSSPSKSITIDQTMMGYMNVLDLLRGRLAGVQVSGSANDPTITIRGVSSLSGSSEPLFLLDGMRTDKSAILMISVADVEKVDILTGGEAGVYGSATGVVSILTKRGNSSYDYTKEKAEGIEIVGMAGYYPTKEFYAPKYDEKIPEHIRPDFRSTIFWLPKIKTDANGKAQFTYFNSEAETKVNICLEGLTSKGIPIVAKSTYSIVRK